MSFNLPEREGGTITYNYFAENIGVAGDVGDQASFRNRQK